MRRLFLSFLALAGIAFMPINSFAAKYKIDSEHSQVLFKVKHLGISNVTGRFNNFTGSFDYDPDNVKASSAEATIEVESVDTDNKERDDHLRSDDFFSAGKHPLMSFKSKGISNVNGESFKLTGDLTINGVTKPVTLDVEVGGVATDPWGATRAAFEASTKINRKDFGLNWNKLLETGGLVVGDEVKITLEIEGVQEKA